MELEIKMVRSTIGAQGKHRKVLQSLGLRKINQVVRHYDSPQILGMIKKVSHMVEVKEI